MRRSKELLMAAGLSVVALFGASACSASGYEVDTTQPMRVESLTFTPEHDVTGPCLISTNIGGVSVCTLYDQVTIDDAWEMRVAQCSDGLPQDRPDSKPVPAGEECGDVRREISEGNFDALAVGDVVTVDEEGEVTRILR